MSSDLRVPTQKLFGRVLVNDKEQAALILAPAGDERHPVYVRYALTELGTLRPLWPALVLDDWGNEIKGLKLYKWVREEGERFPRGEVFGFDDQWEEVQAFLRVFELYMRNPCKVYGSKEVPPEKGAWLKHIILTDETAAEPVSSKKMPAEWPEGLAEAKRPLAQAKVTWWRMSESQIDQFEF